MKKILASCLTFLAIVVLLFTLPFLLPQPDAEQSADASIGLPWEIEVNDAGQSRVFGLIPGASTLEDAEARFGDERELAIIISGKASQGEEAKDAALEAYYTRITLGFIQARLILTLDADPELIGKLLSRSPKGEYMGSGGRRFSLHPDDAKLAQTLPLAAITLIPNARLDAETITLRFGEPHDIVPMGETLQHYLYPDKGLDIILDSKGKEVMQYVAPAEFDERVMRPLRQK